MYHLEINKKCRISSETSNKLSNWEIVLNLEVMEEDEIQTILLGGNTYAVEDEEPNEYYELNFNPDELLTTKPSQAKKETNLGLENIDCVVYNLLINGGLDDGNNKEWLTYHLFTDKGVFNGTLSMDYKGVPTWIGIYILANGVETLTRYDEIFNNFK